MKKDFGFELLGYIVLGFFSFICIIPFIIMIAASFSKEISLTIQGYSVWPETISFDAYSYILNNLSIFGRSIGISIFITIVGTIAHTVLAATLAYPLTKEDMPGKAFFSFLIVITILINGGLVPTYLVYTEIFHIKNTIWALLVPSLLLNGYSIILMRSFLSHTIPKAVIEAASIDGASEWKIFISIIIPMAKPILTTVALMSGMNYWNDWNNGLIYVTKENMLGIQSVLNRIIKNAQFLASNSSLSGGNALTMPIETVRMAVAFIAAVPMVLAYCFLQKYFIAGMTMGAVKE